MSESKSVSGRPWSTQLQGAGAEALQTELEGDGPVTNMHIIIFLGYSFLTDLLLLL